MWLNIATYLAKRLKITISERKKLNNNIGNNRNGAKILFMNHN